MASTTHRVSVDPGSDVAVAVREAEQDGTAVEFETGEATYRLVPDRDGAQADIWAGYRADKVLAALRAARGAFSGLDAKQLLADIHHQREQDSLGRPAEP